LQSLAKRILVLIAAGAFIAQGIVGLLVRVLRGVLFLLVGLMILSAQ
jgi:hypothetical protein